MDIPKGYTQVANTFGGLGGDAEGVAGNGLTGDFYCSEDYMTFDTIIMGNGDVYYYMDDCWWKQDDDELPTEDKFPVGLGAWYVRQSTATTIDFDGLPE